MTTPYAPEQGQFNPFMLMVSPELVVAAMEKSERLNQLNRHHCRPLDGPAPAVSGANVDDQDADGDDDSAPATDDAALANG